MNKQNAYAFDPVHGPTRSRRPRVVYGYDQLVLATAVAEAAFHGLHIKKKREFKQTLFLIVSALVTFIGIGELTVQLLKS